MVFIYSPKALEVFCEAPRRSIRTSSTCELVEIVRTKLLKESLKPSPHLPSLSIGVAFRYSSFILPSSEIERVMFSSLFPTSSVLPIFISSTLCTEIRIDLGNSKVHSSGAHPRLHGEGHASRAPLLSPPREGGFTEVPGDDPAMASQPG
ncbi:hypothetical protein KC19_2G117200 [Ceratodon purpureus]|uniref:Uncharacterized protein n=1 Tax=Ceratodon purpureus TaxID=3225 RepID=A0A8T0IUG7_CERPU|nr:hypothetical protein KC19_2G117200 [Ceratodon purpureus]